MQPGYIYVTNFWMNGNFVIAKWIVHLWTLSWNYIANGILGHGVFSLSLTVCFHSRLMMFFVSLSRSRLCWNLMKINFHLWRQQVKLYINAHSLTNFIVCTQIPPRFLDDVARICGSVNHDYSIWLQKDKMLLWLQYTLSRDIISHVLSCLHAHQLWGHLFNYF